MSVRSTIKLVLQVDELPAQDRQSKERLLSSLTAEPPSPQTWQVGGSTNFMIAAARLGLDVCCCGYVGDDAFGQYLLKCLEVRSAAHAHADTQSSARCASLCMLAYTQPVCLCEHMWPLQV